MVVGFLPIRCEVFQFIYSKRNVNLEAATNGTPNKEAALEGVKGELKAQVKVKLPVDVSDSQLPPRGKVLARTQKSPQKKRVNIVSADVEYRLRQRLRRGREFNSAY